MYRAFQAGGWGMYFVLAFGILGIYGAARFCWRGEAGVAVFARWMLMTTGFSAAFGFFVGLEATANFINTDAKNLDDRLQILIEGTGESLNNLTLGVLLMSLSCLLLAVGYRRFTPPR